MDSLIDFQVAAEAGSCKGNSASGDITINGMCRESVSGDGATQACYH
jgi:hypothetical protein